MEANTLIKKLPAVKTQFLVQFPASQQNGNYMVEQKRLGRRKAMHIEGEGG
jgi:hypothetical protein